MECGPMVSTQGEQGGRVLEPITKRTMGDSKGKECEGSASMIGGQQTNGVRVMRVGGGNERMWVGREEMPWRERRQQSILGRTSLWV